MKRILPVVCLCLLSCVPDFAQQNQIQVASAQNATPDAADARQESRNSVSESAPKLPVRRVVLYKNGIGYFEHLGRVRGSQDVHIDFTSAQLNDVLKSLTVLDLAGGRITGVDYNSEAPLARRLATLRLALGERPTTAEFLGALRGARLEVRSGTGPAVIGKLLSVERKTRTGAGPGWTIETDEISLITDSGEVRSADLNSSTSVRIAEKDLQLEVGKYLGVIASSRDQDVRRMTISTAGMGERNGRLWTTRSEKIGTMWSCHWLRERRIPSFSNCPSRFMAGVPWCHCRKACSFLRRLTRQHWQEGMEH
jgi:hypothetical protein